jgi:hypothetical protein
MPFTRQVLAPALKPLAVGSAGMTFAPQLEIPESQDLIDDRGIRV